MGLLDGIPELMARAALLGLQPADDLVPGDPAEPQAFAADLLAQADRFREGAEAVRAIAVTWEGVAGDAFRHRQQLAAEGWNDAAAAMTKARAAVIAYADALVAARTQAAEASQTFEEGLALAAAQSVEEHNSANAVRDEAGLPAAPPYTQPDRPELDSMSAGRAVRDAAVAMLVAARESVSEEGDACAALLDKLSDPLPWADTGLGGLAEPPGTDGDPSDRPHDPLLGPVPLDDEALQNDKFAQGALGDCWFLSGAGAVADADPEWIREHVHQNPDGSYTVTLYEDGEPVEVTVEASVIEDGARGTDGRPSWISIYEKAAAQHMGGEYGDVEGGWSKDALEMVTGRKAETHDDQDLDDIRRGLDDGRIYPGSTENDDSRNPFDDEVDDDRVVPNHAYMIDEVRDVDGDGDLEVHVVNPWGPDGGSLDGKHRDGDMWLSQGDFHGSFDDVYSVSGR